MEIRKRKVGIVGYGQLGTYLTHAILTDSKVYSLKNFFKNLNIFSFFFLGKRAT